MATNRYIYDQFGSVTRTVTCDEDGLFTLSSSADYEDVIKYNQHERETMTGKEQFRKVATMPIHEVERAMREGWFHDDNALRKWCNDGTNRDFRVWEGHL